VSKKSKVSFKPYSPDQLSLLPPSLSELITENHPVRVVSEVIDRIDLEDLLVNYQTSGASTYHPKLMLKVLIYGYLSNVYSSRKMEAACKENIHFMWLTGMARPDHNTINRFRSERLKGVLKKVFAQVVMLLVDSGHIDLQQVYTDGTKIEANANKYTFVWGKAIARNKLRIKTQLEQLWNYTQTVAKEELKNTQPCDFDQLDPKAVDKTIDAINQALKKKTTADKKIKQKANYAKRNWPDNLRKYEQQEQTLGTRNSYSKTDPEATFMRMKDDHMQNGQLKPGYNLQISTQDQFILHYSLHQNPTDTTTLIPHLEEFKNNYQTLPKEITADAGYGSQENYQYLEDNEVGAFVKYNYFHLEQRKKPNYRTAFQPQNLHYNNELDCYYCPMGQQMRFIGTKKQISQAGYEKVVHRYQAKNCSGCPLRALCHKSKTNRIIEVNHTLNRLKSIAKEKLNSPRGKLHRSKRPVDVEAVFGNLKQNKGFKRYMLRGIEKVSIETGLLAIAMNLKKIA